MRVLGHGVNYAGAWDEASVAEYERQMDELVGEDETVAAYVARIAHDDAAAVPDGSVEVLTDEIERYLRDEPPG